MAVQRRRLPMQMLPHSSRLQRRRDQVLVPHNSLVQRRRLPMQTLPHSSQLRHREDQNMAPHSSLQQRHRMAVVMHHQQRMAAALLLSSQVLRQSSQGQTIPLRILVIFQRDRLRKPVTQPARFQIERRRVQVHLRPYLEAAHSCQQQRQKAVEQRRRMLLIQFRHRYRMFTLWQVEKQRERFMM